MARSRKPTLLIWVTALTLVMACVPTVATPAVPTVDPGVVSTFIAETVNAASTQTAAALPSATPSPSITPIQDTETPSPMPTPTVLIVLPSLTPVVIPTFTNVPSLGGGGTSSDNYACQVTRVTPPNGSVYEPRADFDVFWTVRNIGRRNWDRNEIDYIYLSGDKIHKISGYDLPENVSSGNSTQIGVDLQAPKDPGTYNTTWTLRVGNNEFCPLRFNIVVR
ncbi:MAG: NBR1-Ig-like domain-containing protein [Chloroflexota bacterium]|nr:NBR1-Ig-like domain-containing protein [Chloroflexota bacterium]